MDVIDVPPDRWSPWGLLGLAALFLVLFVPFAAKPVHIDDANFLMLAEGAARDAWRPHAIRINWNGKVEPAFDILANPPGIAWYLAPVRKAPEWLMHVWMGPWLLLAAWGCRQLGRAYIGGGGAIAVLYLLSCPVVVLSAQALTPDLPLFACFTAGVGGFVTARRHAWPWALVAGCAALFRYSGGTVIPLLILAGWRRNCWKGVLTGALSALPIAALVLHDMHAYGQIHLLAMFASQNDPEQKSFSMAVHNSIAGIAMLGGAGVLPVLVWRRETVAAVLVGAGGGLTAAYFADQTPAEAVPTVLCLAAGTAALGLAAVRRVRDPVLSAWALGGATFFFLVRFAAARYWAAFVPGVGLLALRNARGRPALLAVGLVINVLISLGLAIDDQEFARAQRAAAREVARYGTGTFSGHWGWQHYLERAGWTAVVGQGSTASLHAHSWAAAPQLPDHAVCLEVIKRFRMPDRWWGPRVHSPRIDRASYHAGGRASYAPWTLSNVPYDVITVFRRCSDAGDSAETAPK